jgi:hypothetical protein
MCVAPTQSIPDNHSTIQYITPQYPPYPNRAGMGLLGRSVTLQDIIFSYLAVSLARSGLEDIIPLYIAFMTLRQVS